MKKFFLHLTFIIITLISLSAKAQTKISVTNLQCEMLNNPEGIDVMQPRLSWQIKSDVNDVKQTAYQIMVASTLENLNTNKADLWDSGKVTSNESVNIIYNGKKLGDRQNAFWKVTVFTNKGEIKSAVTAHFSIGILTYADWKSTRWIGYEKLSKDDSVSQYSRLSARYLRKEINLKKQVKSAKVYIMGMGLYELYVNGNKIGNQAGLLFKY